MQVFKYDTKRLQKKLSERTIFVLSCVVIFLLWNLYPLTNEMRWEFLRVFFPFLGFLALFLYWLQKKQVELIGKGHLEITEKGLSQWNSNGYCSEILFSECETLKIDSFRSYPRLILETKTKVYPLLNVEDFETFVSILESKTGKKSIVDMETESYFFSKRTFLFLMPSMIFGLLCLFPTGIAFFRSEIFNLFLNVNAIILFLYWKEKENPALPNFSLKRRMLFIAFVLFGFQVWGALGDKLAPSL